MASEHFETDAARTTAADSDLESLLQEAYSAPPVPHSLLEQIDAGVTELWGRSPGLVSRRRETMIRSVAGWTRTLRGWSVAAASLLVLSTVIFVLPGSGNSAWAAMLKAMAEQGLIEMPTPQGNRWLSISEQLIGESDAHQSTLYDARQSILLTRRHGDRQVYRRTVHASATGRKPEGLVMAFLAGLDQLPETADQTADWEILETSAEGTQLHLRFRSPTEELIEVDFTLDPGNSLPLECVVAAAPATMLNYPRQPPLSRRERDFPSALAVVNAPAPSAANAISIPHVPAPSTVPPEVSPIAGEPGPAKTVLALAHAMADVPSSWQAVAPPAIAPDAVVRNVDELVQQLWAKEQLTPAPPAEDTELLRRLYLDLTGRTPTVHEVRAYLKDTSAIRYEQLVDRLLSSPDHASHLATVWRTYLIPDGIDLTAFGGVEAFDRWLAEQFASGAAYDEIVRDLLLAEGRLSQSGPLLFYTAAKLDPDQLAARTSRVFLGVRLECAQCHDHPFEPWSQEDFWSLAAFFSRISRPRGELQAASRVLRVHDIDIGDVMLPDSKTVIPPKFLNTSEPLDESVATARREQLAGWVTSPENPYFARATANRVWGQMFGRGIVDPVDDFGVRNAAVAPELLDLLAGHLIQHQFNLQQLFRVIALSLPYRLSSAADDHNERRLRCFAQMNVKMLTAEQVYDGITVATLLDNASATDADQFNVIRYGNSSREEFLRQFRTPSARKTEYQGGIPQALTLMNGSLIEGATGLTSSGLLTSLEAPFFTNHQRIEIIYLAALSRPPRPAEWELLENYIPAAATGPELRQDLSDILWALLNSAEFTMNH